MPYPYPLRNQLCSLVDLKLAMGVSPTNTSEDYRLALNIDVASRKIENFLGRVFTQQATPTFRTFVTEDPWLCYVDDFMSLEGLIVSVDYAGYGVVTGNAFGTVLANPTVVDTTLTAGIGTTGGDFQLEPINGLIHGQPWAFDRIRAIRSQYFPQYGGLAYPRPYTQALVGVYAMFGWNYVPTDVKKACILEAMKIYKSDDVPFGATPFGETGVLRTGDKMHPETRMLLAPYIRTGVLVA